MMDAATINLWLDQAERDGVISPGFRPQVERKILELLELRKEDARLYVKAINTIVDLEAKLGKGE